MKRLVGHWQLFALAAVVFLFWNTPLVLPIKLLVVFFHEVSHVIATALTGGRVISLSVSPDQGGLVMASGGSRFISLSAGYLGSLLIGIGLLVAATRTRADRTIMAGLGVTTLVIGALYVRDLFAMAFVIGTGLAMLFMAMRLPRTVNDLALRLVGLASMIYVPFDILSDTILRSGIRSDARMLAEEFGGTTIFWGLLWLAISLALIFWCIRRGIGRSSNLRLR